MTEEELRVLVKSVVSEVLANEPVSSTEPTWSQRQRLLRKPHNEKLLGELAQSTPARIATGRTGTRYLTHSYLGLRADHAIALDAVESQIEDAWVQQLSWTMLRSRSKDHQEYLLHPETGRWLDDASKVECQKLSATAPDIQLIAGDGLSAHALKMNGPPLLGALETELKAAGFQVGKPLFVKFARIGVQDEIGVLTRAKATVMVVGERPGLGTGDSLSIYTAFAPRIGQDNAEKDCISNVRAVGFPPAQAARKCADLMKRCFASGGGGVKLHQKRDSA